MRNCSWTAFLPPMQLAAEAIAAGDVTAISPYLKVLDRLDRYQTVASANQVNDDEARQKLLDKINRIAANLGVDEVMAAAARAHLIKIGEIPSDEPDEARGTKGRPARARRRRRGIAMRPTGCPARNLRGEFERSRFFYFFRL